MERLVTKLRKACCRAIASQKVDDDKAVNVASALALTCWWNGFLFSEDAEETEFVVKLEKELELTSWHENRALRLRLRAEIAFR